MFRRIQVGAPNKKEGRGKRCGRWRHCRRGLDRCSAQRWSGILTADFIQTVWRSKIGHDRIPKRANRTDRERLARCGRLHRRPQIRGRRHRGHIWTTAWQAWPDDCRCLAKLGQTRARGGPNQANLDRLRSESGRNLAKLENNCGQHLCITCCTNCGQNRATLAKLGHTCAEHWSRIGTITQLQRLLHVTYKPTLRVKRRSGESGEGDGVEREPLCMQGRSRGTRGRSSTPAQRGHARDTGRETTGGGQASHGRGHQRDHA